MSVTEETDAAQRLLALCKEYTEVIGSVKQEAESVAKHWTEARSSGALVDDKLKAFLQAEYFGLVGAQVPFIVRSRSLYGQCLNEWNIPKRNLKNG